MWITGPQWYFDVGTSAVDCIKSALATAHTTPTSILDFPCGHGRVCRMLRALFPDAYLMACDLDRDGTDFCAAHFSATPFYSREDIREVNLGRCFGLIWCGSLFTHLDVQQWPDFLGFFAQHLEPDGILVFTTHGRQPIQWMREGFFDYGLNNEEQRRLIEGYVSTGFGFVSPTNQAFGISLSSMAFVCRQLERLPSLRLIGFHEAGWAGHQDVVACIRLRKPWPNLDAPTMG
jgi:cyclopropane fatty-acyl-phospholipid synthase-like methyltransferase